MTHGWSCVFVSSVIGTRFFYRVAFPLEERFSIVCLKTLFFAGEIKCKDVRDLVSFLIPYDFIFGK